MSDALGKRLRHALGVIHLHVDDATIDFFRSCITLDSSLDEFEDIVGPFIEESGVDESGIVRERCAIGHAAFLRYDPMQANAAPTGGTPDHSRTSSVQPVAVEGLEQWLRELRLEHYLRPAQNWCREMGAACHEEIFEESAEFCAALNMKSLEKKRIAEWLSRRQQGGAQPMQLTGSTFDQGTRTPQSSASSSSVAMTDATDRQVVMQLPPGQGPPQVVPPPGGAGNQPSSSPTSPANNTGGAAVNHNPAGGGGNAGGVNGVSDSNPNSAPQAGSSGNNTNPPGSAVSPQQQQGGSSASNANGPPVLNQIFVQRTITPQNEGNRVCFGDARDPYVQCEELGAGAMATVYRCYRRSKPEDNFAAKVISLKRLKLNHAGFSREYSKLQREAQILSTLRNKYITSLVDVIEQRDNLYLVMEIVQHGELFDRILDHDNDPYVARFSEPEARYVFVQISAGLKYVHMKQIVHRDLKPENILVYRRYPLIKPSELSGDARWNMVECDHAATGRMMAYEIKLSDFGLAKLVADGYSIATTRTGTPQYWAPEVATSLGAHRASGGEGVPVQGYGFSADLWSLGVVLYVLLCGRYPFTGDSRQMENNQIRGYFEFPKKCSISNEAKYLITGLVRRAPNARISLLNCLRCKWATKSILHMKCSFYRPKVPMSQWKSRNILLPLAFDRTTAYIMSAVFRSFPIGMDPNVVFLRSDAFPSPPAVEKEGLTEHQIMKNVASLDKFKNALIRFVNDNFLEDSLDYEIDSYGDRYFYFNFKYLPDQGSTSEEQVMVRSAGEEYERGEDPIAHEILYNVVRTCFPTKILELVTLRVTEVVDPSTGEKRAHCGLQLEQSGQIGLIVKAVDRDSPMKGKIFSGDLLLELQGKPLTTTNLFQIYCATGNCLLVQRGA
ncbi:unnamed protein product [Amoebophrya sp. A25]|nr:unnamed protein product [Amoebophrya sp. A25]|eukprot:GSA25T00023878001.1